MICKSCHREWIAAKGKIYIFCPFCQKPIISIQKKFNTIEEALGYLTSQYTPDILDDKQTVIQFIETFLPEKKRERSFLNMAYASGLVKAILARRQDPEKKQQMFVQQAIEELQNIYGISEEWASYIINSIASSSGILFHNRNSSVQRKIEAENGNVQAQLSLALDYLAHEDVENYIRWIQMAIENESTEAEYHYGKYLFQQDQSRTEGIQLLMKSAEKHNMDSICYIAKNIASLSVENKQKVEIIVGKSELTYDLLSVQQIIDLSYYFEYENNLNLAIKLLEFAFEKEPTITWSRYVEVLEKRSASADHITIGKVYRKVAENGNLSAIKALAGYVEKKASSTADMKTALYWYKMAADAGDIESQLRLASAYETGDRITKDIKKAVEWYEIAAVNGSNEAYQKISFKSPHCIRKTVTLILEDDSILECNVQGFFSDQGTDYLIVVDPETDESIPLIYHEIGTEGDFEVEAIDEEQENDVLQAFRRTKIWQ